MRNKREVPERFKICSKCGSETQWKDFNRKTIKCSSCLKSFKCSLTGEEEQILKSKKQPKKALTKLVENEMTNFEYQKNLSNFSGNTHFSMINFEIFSDLLKKVEKKEKIYVESYIRCGGSYSNAAMMSNTSYSKLYAIMLKYKDVAELVREVMLNDVEHVAWYLASKRYNSKMIEFILKSLDPKFKEKIEQTVTVKEPPHIVVEAFEIEDIEEIKDDEKN
jgi:hypothetical protein